MSRNLAFAVVHLGRRRMRAALAAMLSLALAPSAYATIFVANDGADGPTCGEKKAPCRSIGRAIANAGAGDTIIVGPGHYGDLDGDGTLGEPGEEKVFAPCGIAAGPCIVCVDKPVRIVSRDGAASTVIEARMVDMTATVLVAAPGAAVGAAKKGFTIVGGEALGLRLPIGFVGNGGAAVGNRLSGHISATLTGSGHVFKANQLHGIQLNVSGSGHQVVGNEIVDAPDVGISIGVCPGCRVASNLVLRSGSDGIRITNFNPGPTGERRVVEGNVVSASLGHGFANFRTTNSEPGNALFRGNVASRNVGAGFQIDGPDITLSGNVAIGNGGAGVQIDATSTAPVLVANDFVANGSGAGDLCGVKNLSPQPVAATQSYWGAATGPGPRPADAACSGPGVVLTAPFATKPHKVKPKLSRIE